MFLFLYPTKAFRKKKRKGERKEKSKRSLRVSVPVSGLMAQICVPWSANSECDHLGESQMTESPEEHYDWCDISQNPKSY